MKKLTALLLVFFLLAGCLLSCGEETISTSEETKENKTEESGAPTTSPKKTEQKTEATHMLDGKKVIFVGNSYTYYGNCVLTKSATIRTQAQRLNDRGYFYQLCKENGANVQVTNWTFGSHGLKDLFEGCTISKYCSAGYQHASDLKDSYYDYVFLQDRTGEEFTADGFLAGVQKTVDFFRAANPDVKIFFFAQSRLYEWQVSWLPALKELDKMGVTVIEWGALVEEVISGKTAVPGATQQYNRNSFIIRQSADDGYHPNPLTGYITAQMAYCAITGESAVGQPYSFCTDSSIQSAYNITNYITRYYKNGATTNLKAIFQSAADMKGLQTLMDRYLAEQNYKNY